MVMPIERFVLRSVKASNPPLYYTVRGWDAESTHDVWNAVVFPNDALALPKNMKGWEKVPVTIGGAGFPKLL